MNYSLLIEERRSSRAFKKKAVSKDLVSEIYAYHDSGCARLIPEIKTELIIVNEEAKENLEKAAGYNEFLVGAPQYMVLLSDEKEGFLMNAGYIMEDLILKLADLGCGSCWLTFTDGQKIKEAIGLKTDQQVAALAAFGYPERARKRIHLNIFSMSNIGVSEKLKYHDPKKKVTELVYNDSYGNTSGLEERLGFYGDILWEAFYAAANSPSYMNRQPYSFLLKDDRIYLLAEKDEFTRPIDAELNLGVAMLQFAAVAQSYAGSLKWKLGGDLPDLPAGVRVAAYCEI